MPDIRLYPTSQTGRKTEGTDNFVIDMTFASLAEVGRQTAHNLFHENPPCFSSTSNSSTGTGLLNR